MLYRIDTFSIPAAARAVFDLQSSRTMALLQSQPGFIDGQTYEKVSGGGSVDLVTIVTWLDEDSVRSAGQAVRALHESVGFDAASFSREHGIVESKALYVSGSEDGRS